MTSTPSPAEPATVSWFTPALMIAVMALLFTVGSFYWLHARRGKLKIYPPSTYGGAFGRQWMFVLPLVFHNTGPKPYALLDFRLRLVPATRDLPSLQMFWHATQTVIEGDNDGRQMARAFAVNGRTAFEKCLEFKADGVELSADDGPFTVTVQAMVGDRRRWQELLTFTLHTERTEPQGRNAFLARSNDADGLR